MTLTTAGRPMLTEVLSRTPFGRADLEAGIPDLNVGDPGDREVIRYVLASVVVAPTFFFCRGIPDCHLRPNQPTDANLMQPEHESSHQRRKTSRTETPPLLRHVVKKPAEARTAFHAWDLPM